MSLTFDYHITKVYNKTCHKLGAIRKVRKCLDKSVALTLYRSLVLPHYDYCNTSYRNANKESLNKLQLVQNMGCRTILLARRRTHIADMHKELNLMPLHNRREAHYSLLCHKNIYPEGSQSLTKYFIPARIVGGRRTRGNTAKNMQVPNIKSEKGRCAFAYQGPTHWNSLSPKLKSIEKYNSFKTELLKSASAELDNHPT